jgi:Rap1a immunity proteins
VHEVQLVYDGGRCIGFVTAVAFTDLGVCLPAHATIDQMMRVVVRYVDARPERAQEAFATLAQEASGPRGPVAARPPSRRQRTINIMIPGALKGAAIRPSHNPQWRIFERPVKPAFPPCNTRMSPHHHAVPAC